MSVEVKEHKITYVQVVKDVMFTKPEVTSELIQKVVLRKV